MNFIRQMGMVLVIASFCLVVALAQDSEKKPADKAMSKSKAAAKSETMNMGMPMAKPSADMEKMAKMLVGTWATTETFEVSDMMPKGGKGTGMAVIKPGPGGLSIVEDYHSQGGLGAFAGHGVFWWDEKAQGFKNVWCDNMTPGGCTPINGMGKWEGSDLVFNDEQDMMGKKMGMKQVLTAAGSSVTLTMSSSEDGGPMKKMMTIKYTKMAAKHQAMPSTPGN
ncbi:MAG: DUF1579 domain-containing protein [Acidobacteriia bacterium]|nr:DUF1579 domain-containing protein [Terriglobia bacterium]